MDLEDCKQMTKANTTSNFDHNVQIFIYELPRINIVVQVHIKDYPKFTSNIYLLHISCTELFHRVTSLGLGLGIGLGLGLGKKHKISFGGYRKHTFFFTGSLTLVSVMCIYS